MPVLLPPQDELGMMAAVELALEEMKVPVTSRRIAARSEPVVYNIISMPVAMRSCSLLRCRSRATAPGGSTGPFSGWLDFSPAI